MEPDVPAGDGEDAQPMFLEPKKLIRKECADVCTAARNERFSAAKGEEFEKAIKGIFSIDEAQDLIELRKLVGTNSSVSIFEMSNHYHILMIELAALEKSTLLATGWSKCTVAGWASSSKSWC
ncbi:unnamed protein product [Cylicostephanus goldi]|uniref:Uncharacterized protein n=1 Tax=Cylicostephanus goldi TaxID=71465 RepID=A0A3P6SW95_CYLGO|nr:unnamed protein product [Cylicostephanus goldi]